MLEKKAASGLLLALLLVGILSLAFNIQLASGTIYVRADGSIDPPNAPLSTADSITYTFTRNIKDEIVVERDNIVVDGVGYTLQGRGEGYGIYLASRINVTVKNMRIEAFGEGIYLSASSNNKIVGNDITANDNNGIYLSASSNNFILGNSISSNWDGIYFFYDSSNSNTISGNNITANSRYGIWLYTSSNNFISGNNITANGSYGINIYVYSNGNTISGNNMTNNEAGMFLERSSNNVLRNNTMADNLYNIGVAGETLSDYINDVDVSNTVDSKPVYYWVNRRDETIPFDAGYVALISSENITIKELELRDNWASIQLVFTSDSRIIDNNITDNGNGIILSGSYNTVSGNEIANNSRTGIKLSGQYNNISGNNIANSSWEGIWLSGGDDNSIAGNNITSNNRGVYLQTSGYNNFIHNNFVNNTLQVLISSSYVGNHWDDGYPLGGNYWSNYTGVDLWWGYDQNVIGSDGIGDTPYVIDVINQDNYPLMSPSEYWSNPMLGDINKDRKVDNKDLSTLAAAYGSTTSSGNPNCDINEDGKVDIIDLFDLGKNYGETYP